MERNCKIIQCFHTLPSIARRYSGTATYGGNAYDAKFSSSQIIQFLQF